MSNDDSWTVEEAISNLKDAMNESNQSAADVFSSIDANDDGEINVLNCTRDFLSTLGTHCHQVKCR